MLLLFPSTRDQRGPAEAKPSSLTHPNAPKDPLNPVAERQGFEVKQVVDRTSTEEMQPPSQSMALMKQSPKPPSLRPGRFGGRKFYDGEAGVGPGVGESCHFSVAHVDVYHRGGDEECQDSLRREKGKVSEGGFTTLWLVQS